MLCEVADTLDKTLLEPGCRWSEAFTVTPGLENDDITSAVVTGCTGVVLADMLVIRGGADLSDIRLSIIEALSMDRLFINAAGRFGETFSMDERPDATTD